tara:strand:+ start:66 stop:491 length:426 start_codon:yes stop_codon:yes gene_type:complete
LDTNYTNIFFEFLSDYKIYLVWLGTLSFTIFIFSLLTIKWLVALIPSDYFIKKNNSEFRSNYPIFWLVSIIIKNLVGYTLIVGGILMLVLPGQGLFTIFVGLMLSNYPGKFYIERKFIAIPSVLRAINWLRKKSNTPSIKI